MIVLDSQHNNELENVHLSILHQQHLISCTGAETEPSVITTTL